jgi:hypothetical protein
MRSRTTRETSAPRCPTCARSRTTTRSASGNSLYEITTVGERSFFVEEYLVSKLENIIRIQMGYPLRTHYGVDADGRGGIGPSVITQDIEMYRK